MKNLAPAFLCLFYSVFLSGQSVHFKNYNVDNGLLSNQVYDILEDKSGYIWFASDLGISKYNGVEFELFTVAEGLPDNTIFGLFEDRKGRIWLRSFNGILSYIDQNDSIHEVSCGLNFGTIHSLYIDQSDTLWLTGGNNQYKLFNIEEENCQVERLDEYCVFRQIDSTSHGCIIGAVSGKIKNQYMLNGEIFPLNSPVAANMNLNRSSLNGYNIDHGHAMFDLDKYVFSLKKDSCEVLYKNEINRINLNILGKDEIFIGEPGGAKFFDREFSRKMHLLKDLHITKCLKDREGGYWFSSLSQGVFYASTLDVEVFDLGKSSIISDLIFGGRKQLYAIGYFGDVYEKKGDRFKKVYSNDLNTNEYLYHKFNSSGQLVIVADNYALCEEKNRLKRIESEPLLYTLDSNNVGVAISNIILNDSIRYQFARENSTRRLKHFHPYLFKDTIYIPCLGGLYSFDMTNKLRYFGADYPELSRRVNIIRMDKYNRLWIGTNASGILVLDNRRLVPVGSNLNRIGSRCKNLEIDDNHAWFSTELGLAKVDLTDLENIETFSTTDGLLSNAINCITLEDSMIYLCHGNGITKFPKSHQPKLTKPILLIDEIRIGNKAVEKQPHYHLDYKAGHININYMGISYSSILKYAYRLRNQEDTTWRFTDERNVEFVSIPPGKYNFEVFAINDLGVKSEIESVVFLVRTPFWMTFWFVLICIVILVLMISIIISYRFRKLRSKIEIQRKMILTEQQALSARMNPHFIFNALNSIQKFLLTGDRKSSNKYLTIFSRLMRNVLDNSKENLIPLESEIEALNIYLELESMRFKDKFSYKINIDQKLDMKSSKIPPLLFQPYVENAIWHGLMHKTDGVGKLTIDLVDEGKHITCIISDNGIGRSEALSLKKYNNIKYKSSGMTITGRRMELVEKFFDQKFSSKIVDLYDKGCPSGTRVEINFPKL